MGDGRYYTFYQFFDVLFITILLIGSLFSIVYIYYRKNERADLANMFFPLGAISVFGIIRLVEHVYPYPDLCLKLRNLSLILFLVILITSNLSKFRFDKWLYISMGVLLIILANMMLLVSAYNFHEMSYTYIYKILLLIVLIHATVVSIRQILNYHLYLRRIPAIILYVVPIILYVFTVLSQSSLVDYFEIGILMLIILYINIRFIKSDESSYTVMAFDKIGNMGSSYIFVIDENNRVIYRNNAAKNPQVFNGCKVLDIYDFSGLFKCDIHKKHKYNNKEYIELTIGEEKIYFSYSISDLIDDKNLVGHIITFIDITELLNLLIDLEEKKAESKQVNDKLLNYSQVVYHLEKEKEINKLLEEIITSRDKQMDYLSHLVEKASNELNDEMFEHYIEIAINASNEILDDVRDTVSNYREYYGG